MATITLSPETEKLLRSRMQRDGHASLDEAVHAALMVLNDVEDEDRSIPDAGTLAAIDEANRQIERGEGMPVDEAFRRIRAKHLGA